MANALRSASSATRVSHAGVLPAATSSALRIASRGVVASRQFLLSLAARNPERLLAAALPQPSKVLTHHLHRSAGRRHRHDRRAMADARARLHGLGNVNNLLVMFAVVSRQSTDYGVVLPPAVGAGTTKRNALVAGPAGENPVGPLCHAR